MLQYFRIFEGFGYVFKRQMSTWSFIYTDKNQCCLEIRQEFSQVYGILEPLKCSNAPEGRGDEGFSCNEGIRNSSVRQVHEDLWFVLTLHVKRINVSSFLLPLCEIYLIYLDYMKQFSWNRYLPYFFHSPTVEMAFWPVKVFCCINF